MNTSQAFELNPKPGIPSCSWWADAERERFTEQCAREALRMAGSKIARSLGLPMVIAQVDRKRARTS
jgi:hypothetical protein